MECRFVIVEEHQGQLSWTIDRKDRGNGLGPSIIRELNGLLDDLVTKENKPRLLTIRAKPIQGPKSRLWIAGGDLKELSELKSQAEGYLFARSVSLFLYGLSQLPLPVLMVIDGDAIGGGCEFALGGDVRLSCVGSHFHFKQFHMGLPTGFGGAGRLSRIVGSTRSEALIYGAEKISASQAFEMGMIHDLAESPDALDDLILDWSKKLTSTDSQIFVAQKKMFSLWRHPREDLCFEEEAKIFGSLWMNGTHQKKLADFLEARKNK